ATRNLPKYQERFTQLITRISETVPLENLGLRVQAGQLPTISAESIHSLIMSGLSSAADIVTGAGLVLVFVVFLLMGHSERVLRPGTLLHQIETRAQRYILQMVGFSALTGLLVGLCLGILGVDFAFAFGFIAFLFNFIPTVGSVIATLLP